MDDFYLAGSRVALARTTRKMPTFHLKVTCHKKNQEDVQMNEKNPTDVNTKMTEKLVSSDKVIKAVMIKNASMCS